MVNMMYNPPITPKLPEGQLILPLFYHSLMKLMMLYVQMGQWLGTIHIGNE